MTLSYDELFRRACGFDPFPWQRTFATAESLPELVRMPTGAGKTEAAALGWLFRRRHADTVVRDATPRRLVYCLPMRVLVEQTVKRIRSQLDAAGAADIAVHQLMGGAVSREWTLRPEDDAVLVGTLDQLVSRALMRGYGVSRYAWPVHFALLHNDALWIFDEVQLMGEALATSAQLDGFRSTFPSSVGAVISVWMSATVDPVWLETVDRPSAQSVLRPGPEDRAEGLGKRLSAEKLVTRIDALDPVALAEAHRTGTLTLAVMNTVKSARELYSRLSKLRGVDAETVLLHSRFRPPDRRANVERLDAALDPSGPGRIIVATQVVEAGVDISAATLLTEAAPWASLVQRFGRCNRQGEIHGARVLWAPPTRPHPYEETEIDAAVETLSMLEGTSVSPDALEALDAPLTMPPRKFVIRRRDFLGLFDTAPDLSGLDLDIQRYIRDGDDLTASIAWRELEGEAPSDDEPDLLAVELCPAPLGELRKLVDDRRRDGQRTWRFDPLDAAWVVIAGREIRPGDRLLVDTAYGAYEPGLGFDPAIRPAVPAVEIVSQPPPDGVDTDRERGGWLSVAEHTNGVVATLEGLLVEVGGHLSDEERQALTLAARHHDWGKAHAVFQTAMHAGDTVPTDMAESHLAKRVGRAPRYERRGFRHELASTLAYLRTATPDPLVAYLVASHHGRVRLGARSLPVETWAPDGRGFVLGCWEGDEMPEVDLGGGVRGVATTLSLVSLELGSDDGETYTDMALAALERLGPYRLSFLEAILRTADRRRSAEEAAESV